MLYRWNKANTQDKACKIMVSRATFWMSSFVVSSRPSDVVSLFTSPHLPSVCVRRCQTCRPFFRVSCLTRQKYGGWQRADLPPQSCRENRSRVNTNYYLPLPTPLVYYITLMDLYILCLHTCLCILSFRSLMIILIKIFCHHYNLEMPPKRAGIQDIGLWPPQGCRKVKE